MTAEERDVALGALLRDLPAPDHAPGFFETLEAKLQQEPNAVTPATTAAPDVAPLAPRRRTRRRMFEVSALGAAAALVAFAVIVGIDTGAGPGPFQPRMASAAEVVNRMTRTLAAAESMRGEYVVRDPEGTRRWTFVARADGSLRLTDRDFDLAYDAETGVERSITLGGPEVFAGERVNIAPGPPDPGPADWTLQRELGAVTRALLAANDATVTETTWNGQPAWQLDADVDPSDPAGDLAVDHVLVTVEQRSALPVRIHATRDGKFIRETTVENLVLDSPTTAADFTLAFPPGVRVHRTDVGFRRVPLDEVAGLAGYRPLVPRTLPSGFELAEVAVAEEGGFTGVEGMNPTSLNVVSLAYRRGLDRVVVSTRLRNVPTDEGSRWLSHPECRTCLPGSYWSDPLASGEGITDEPESITVSGGALAGSAGQVLITPTAVPHVWALSADLVVTVAGDLTRAELLAALNSLETR